MKAPVNCRSTVPALPAPSTLPPHPHRSHRTVVKDESILVFDNGDRNPEFDRRAALPFGNPTRVFLENGKDLLLVRNRLATQKTPLHLVNLPPGEPSPRGGPVMERQRNSPSRPGPDRAASARSTSARQRSTYAASSGCRCARLVERKRTRTRRAPRAQARAGNARPTKGCVRRKHVRLDDERVTPPEARQAFFFATLSALHHQAPDRR